MSNSELNNKSFSASVSQNNLSPEDFDRKLKADLKVMFPRPLRSGPGAAQPGNLDVERARAACGACPILDTPTPECEKIVPRSNGSTKFLKNRTSRRIYSRTMLGLHLPGRYYFLTLTSSPDSPPIKKSFNKLRMWLKAERPGISWIVVFTDEGFGVIHMVFRLPLRSKNIDVRLLRARWKKWHKAIQVKVMRARSDHEKLADYLADQRKMKKLGSEMSWQNSITSWGWSKGWLPKGYTKAFGRFYIDIMDAPDTIKQNAIRVNVCLAHEAEKKAGES